MMKNSLSDVSWRRQERETGGEIQTTIDTSPETLGIHAPHQVEENMPENHSRRRLVIFGRRMKPYAPPKKCVSEDEINN